MRRFITCALALAVCGLCGATPAAAQEKIAASTHTEACAPSCLDKVCIAVPDKKKISKVEYSCTQKDICLPRCSFRFGFGHSCCEDDCLRCGRPRTVNVLMKRSVSHECPSMKCVVSHQPAACAPACRPGCAPDCAATASTGHATTATMPSAPPSLTIEGVR